MATVSFEKFSRLCGSRVVAALILLNTAVWAIVALSGALPFGMLPDENLFHRLLALPSSWQSALLHPWTLLTYMVTQFSLLHLLFNMLWLFWFGRLALTLLSERQLLWLYIGGGITGGMLYVLTPIILGIPTQGAYLCGSSAAVLAVMAASAVLTPNMRINLFLIGEVKLKWVAAVCIGLSVFGIGGSAVSQAAHIGGAVFGLLYPLLLRKGVKISLPRRKLRLKPRPRNGAAVARAASNVSDEGRLDELLDKIRFSGYSSLSEGEKNELTLLSRRIK